MNGLKIIEQDIYAARPQFEAVLTDRDMRFEREAGFAMQTLEANSFALSIAQRNRQSVVNAITNVAAIGLSLNPATKLAYLVPRKTGIVLEISYIGLVKLATDTGSVRWVKAELVYEADHFEIDGYGKPPVHRFNPFAKDRGPVVGAYCVAKTSDGDYLTDAMSIEEIHAIRDRSEAWKNGQKGPWKTDPGEMAKKTVVKRASKLWPHSERLDQAVHLLNTEGEEGIDFTQAAGFDVTAALEAVAAAQTRAELDAVWESRGKAAMDAKDRDAWRRIKKACQERAAAIDGKTQAQDVEAKEPTHA
ncbi:MAG: recombinase RecT [Burkholderiaceae bacterium]